MIVRHNLPIHDCSAYTRLFSLYTIVQPIHDCSAYTRLFGTICLYTIYCMEVGGARRHTWPTQLGTRPGKAPPPYQIMLDPSLYTIVQPIHDCSAQSAYTRFTAWRWGEAAHMAESDRHNSAPELAEHPLPARSYWIHPCTRLFSLYTIVRHNLPIHDFSAYTHSTFCSYTVLIIHMRILLLISIKWNFVNLFAVWTWHSNIAFHFNFQIK
jgi:hypothetical protein